MSTRHLEDDLLIWAWGSWARERIHRELGHKEAPWAYLMDTDSGYDEEPINSPPPAPDGWCERLDAMIAAMGRDTVYVMTSLYAVGIGVNALARRKRRDGKSLNNRNIMQIRDACLNRLHGALFLSQTGT